MLKIAITEYCCIICFLQNKMTKRNANIVDIQQKYHTCEPLLLDMREIWFSFQGDWGLHQGDCLMAFLMRRFKLFKIKLERNFKKYMNYSTLCFKFTLKLTKISTKDIKTERFQCN